MRGRTHLKFTLHVHCLFFFLNDNRRERFATQITGQATSSGVYTVTTYPATPGRNPVSHGCHPPPKPPTQIAQNTKICYGHLRTGFCSSDTRQYSGSLLRVRSGGGGARLSTLPTIGVTSTRKTGTWYQHGENRVNRTAPTALHTLLLVGETSLGIYHFSTVVNETLRTVSGQWLKGMYDRTTGHSF
jgi:hypothetical protein